MEQMKGRLVTEKNVKEEKDAGKGDVEMRRPSSGRWVAESRQSRSIFGHRDGFAA